MTITTQMFEQLCRDASVHLALPDAEALGGGSVVYIEDVESWVAFNEARLCAQLWCELGDPVEVAEGEVCRQLLELQSVFVGQVDAMFVRDAVNERLLFTARMPLHAQLTPEDFANALSLLAGQVRLWQSTILAGLMIDYEQELRRHRSTGGPLAPRRA